MDSILGMNINTFYKLKCPFSDNLMPRSLSVVYISHFDSRVSDLGVPYALYPSFVPLGVLQQEY